MTVEESLTRSRSSGILAPIARFRPTVIVSVGAIALVIALGIAVAHSSAFARFELPIDQAISRHHVGLFDSVALVIEWLFSPVQAFVILVVASVITLIVRRSWTIGITFALVVLGGWLGSEAVKLIVHRARPDYHLLAHPLVLEHNFASFPSGHTCAVTALGVGLVFLFRGTPTLRWLAPLVVLSLLVVAFSRVYVGAHYPTDVIAALIYTPAVMITFLALWNRWVAASLLKRIG